MLDDRHLLVPDRRGNRRLDGMRNILANPHVGLLFIVPGREDTLRVNGRAWVTRDAALLSMVPGIDPDTVTETAAGNAPDEATGRAVAAIVDPTVGERPGHAADAAADLLAQIVAHVPQDARTASTLGTERRGTGVVIDDSGLVLTIGYLVLLSPVDLDVDAVYTAEVGESVAGAAFERPTGISIDVERVPGKRVFVPAGFLNQFP